MTLMKVFLFKSQYSHSLANKIKEKEKKEEVKNNAVDNHIKDFKELTDREQVPLKSPDPQTERNMELPQEKPEDSKIDQNHVQPQRNIVIVQADTTPEKEEENKKEIEKKEEKKDIVEIDNIKQNWQLRRKEEKEHKIEIIKEKESEISKKQEEKKIEEKKQEEDKDPNRNLQKLPSGGQSSRSGTIKKGKTKKEAEIPKWKVIIIP